jgi:membrane protein
MRNFWRPGGLSIAELLRRTVRESWEDSIFGQGSRMAFYHFLAIFPSILAFLVISAPHLDPMKNALLELSSQVLPDQVSELFQKMIDELNERPHTAAQTISLCAGAVWAALNGTWAMIYGLNTAYEVDEIRPKWELGITIAGVTVSLAVTGSIAVFLIFFGASLQAYLHWGAMPLRILEWLVVTASLSVSFAVLYRFAPNPRPYDCRWSTPGALCAVVLWIASTFAARVYFNHVNTYASSYGRLNSTVMLLLWLYVTNGAILFGGELNSEIEKAVMAQAGRRPAPRG